MKDDHMDACFPKRASMSLQKNIHDMVQLRRSDQHGKRRGNKYDGNLCLHSRQLNIYHPITSAPIILEADPPF